MYYNMKFVQNIYNLIVLGVFPEYRKTKSLNYVTKFYKTLKFLKNLPLILILKG